MAKNEDRPEAVEDAIVAIMADLSEVGIAKNNVNQDEGWKSRSIDDVYNTLSKLLSKYGLLIVPDIKERSCEPRLRAGAATLYHTVLKIEYAFRVGKDEMRTTVYGEASDFSDKGLAKAMSAAYKQLCFQVFCIPVLNEDPDRYSPHEQQGYQAEENERRQRSQAPRQQPAQQQPAQQQAPQQQAPQQQPAQGVQVPKGQQAKQQQANQQPAQQQRPTLDSVPEGPMDINDQAGLALRIEQARDDADAKYIAGDLWRNRHRIPKKASMQEMARLVLTKRAEFVIAEDIESLDKMATQFCKEGMVTKDEALAMQNRARSRLNLEILTG